MTAAQLSLRTPRGVTVRRLPRIRVLWRRSYVPVEETRTVRAPWFGF